LGATGSCHVRGYDDPMTEPRSRRGSTLAIGVGLVMGLLIAACSPGLPPSPSNPPSAPGSSPAPSAPSTAATNATDGSGIGQTDTDWGRIWDGLPEAFPVYPGATPADDAATEVVTAAFALTGADARTVAAWMQAELERATYATEALNGPMEDGSFILESVGSGDCRIQVAVAPAGGLTTVSVRYGAACPAP